MKDSLVLKYKKMLMLASKIGVGACAAICAAQYLELEFATSSGIITLLTLITTKWETLKLSALRIVTYVITVVLCYVIFHFISIAWIAYGIFLFFTVLLCEGIGWRNTLSVNAVIGTHFLTKQDFSVEFLLNEFLLVLIGITIAILLNLFHINSAQELGMIKSMRLVENKMKQILEELSGYLAKESSGDSVWTDLYALRKALEEYLQLACEYERNTFHTHTKYYVDYFEMRIMQCGALENLHTSMMRIRDMPIQAKVVSEYIREIAQHVTEMNDPKKQMQDLEGVLEHLRTQPLPTTHEEFENRAELYHTISDLEEFLLYKRRFIDSVDEKQFQIYWKREIEGK